MSLANIGLGRHLACDALVPLSIRRRASDCKGRGAFVFVVGFVSCRTRIPLPSHFRFCIPRHVSCLPRTLTDLLFCVYIGIPLSGLMHVIQTKNPATISMCALFLFGSGLPPVWKML